MGKAALILIYNHHFTKNIDTLEKIYRDRFSIIYHLIPFYRGDRENVIPVYDNSYFFQGYISQGLKVFGKEKADHFIFAADDLMINPLINETNYSEHLNLKENSSFLPGLVSFHERKEWWARTGDAFNYSLQVPGVEAGGHLPEYEEALKCFKRFNLEIKPLSYNQIWKEPIVEKSADYNLTYPLAGSYSDFFVISSKSIKSFSHYCGVFAATKLFVEVAIPTAVILSADEIVLEKDINLRGRALWTPDDYKILDEYNFNLNKLLKNFPKNYLYLHPIKLSKWENVE